MLKIGVKVRLISIFIDIYIIGEKHIYVGIICYRFAKFYSVIVRLFHLLLCKDLLALNDHYLYYTANKPRSMKSPYHFIVNIIHF